MNLVSRKTSKQEFIERKAIIQAADPASYSEIFDTQRAQLTDGVIFSKKAVSEVTSFDEMFKSDDAKQHNIINIANAKLPAGKWFLANRIMLLTGVNADVGATAWGAIADDVRNGEIEITLDKKPIVSKMPISALFADESNSDHVTGLAWLDNPKMLEPEKDLLVRLWFPVATATNTNLYLALLGTQKETY